MALQQPFILVGHGKERPMNKSNAIFLVAGLIVGLIVGGLSVALWDARYNAVAYSYASDFIMRQSNQLSTCQQQNKELQKEIQELERREKDRP
jgi:cell division protein FtsL